MYQGTKEISLFYQGFVISNTLIQQIFGKQPKCLLYLWMVNNYFPFFFFPHFFLWCDVAALTSSKE